MNNIKMNLSRSGDKIAALNGIEVTVAKSKDLGIRSEVNIKFLNGEVTIPKKYGGYVIASGCGAGKTTAIKLLILMEKDYGVLYAASTINECNEMYQFLKNEGVNPNDMVVLHSNTMNEGVDLKVLRNNPSALASKKIIICTHHKLLNEYPESLLAYNRNIIRKSELSILARGKYAWDVNGQKKFPRRYIIIDELPTCQSLSFDVDLGLLRMLGLPDTEKATKIDPVTGNLIEYTTAKLPIRYTNGGDYQIAESLVDASNVNIFDRSTESGKLKNDLAVSMIYEEYDQLTSYLEYQSKANIDRKGKDRINSIKLNYTIADQVAAGDSGETTYLLFDGTGDLTFYENTAFEVLSYQNKYNSPISINRMDLGYKRAYRTEPYFQSSIDQIITNMDYRARDIAEMTNFGHKVLVVTWMSFKVRGEDRGVPIYDKGKFLGESGIEDYLRARIIGYKGDPNKFSIIHYQSGLDKATNEFRDYDTIIFLGEFHVPDYVVWEFNKDYRSNTTVEKYTLYQLVQAVCRTRIRNHNKESINVFFTMDWDSHIIDELKEYLSNNMTDSQVIDNTLDDVSSKWKEVAKLFCDLNDEFKECIRRKGKTCKLEFNLDDIYSLVPMSSKEVRKYYPMINYFRKNHGIEIVIRSNSNRTKDKV